MNKMSHSRAKDFLFRSLKTPSIVVGVVLLVIIFLLVFIGPLFTGYDANQNNYEEMLQRPSRSHWLGTDSMGRDLLTRILIGGQVSLLIGLEVMLSTTIFGSLIALLGGYFKKVDVVIMRVMDVMMAFPTLLLAIVLAAIFTNSITGVSIALTIAYTPRTVRIVRSSILTIREETYIEAAQATGVRPLSIMVKHVFPGTLPVLIVQETFLFAYAILAEAGISFIGVGVQPPDASWGNILSDATSLMREAPWNVIAPGLAIVITVLALNLIGDGLREVLDPKRMKGKVNA